MSEEKLSEFSEAIAAVIADSSNTALWESIENLASDLDAPEQVAAAYNQCLVDDLSSEEAGILGQRAAHFHEEWFGDDRDGLATLLSKILSLSPKNEWAVQKLTYVLTVAERWDDVIALYRKVIAQTTDQVRLIKLLDEAFQVTKDLANRPDLAIDFLKQKIELAPNAKQLAALERLLERHERWEDLIALWRDALPKKATNEVSEALTRIATTYFQKLSNLAASLQALQELFDKEIYYLPSLQLLEEIAIAETCDSALRKETLVTLRSVHESAERPEEIVRVLSEVLPLCDEDERKNLHGELGERLSELEEHAASMDHYAALLLLDPSSALTQRNLRREAQFTKNFEHYATSLASAAECSSDTDRRVSLLSDAALALVEFTNNEPRAIDLLQSALAIKEINSKDVLNLGKRLNTLLNRADRSDERLLVLEQLELAESVPSSRKVLTGEVAKLAKTLDQPDRAIEAWRRRLSVDPGDLPALEQLIELLNNEERWAELIEVLHSRTEQDVPASQKRSDMIRLALVHEEKLDQKEQALTAWSSVREIYGEDSEGIAALTRLMTQLEKWEELTTLLEGANTQQVTYLANQFASLGKAYQQSLDDDLRSIECFRRALAVDVTHEGARSGLQILLEREATRSAAAEALEHSLRTSGDLPGLLAIVEARIEGADDERKHAEIYREAVDIAQFQADDKEKALHYATRLFPLEPRDRVLEDRMCVLAKETEHFQSTLEAFASALTALEEDSYAIAQMRFREAVFRERVALDHDGAIECCQQVLGTLPDHHDAVETIIRLGGPENRYVDMLDATLSYGAARNSVPDDFINSISAFAETNHSWARFCEAMTSCVSSSTLTKRDKAELFYRVARWQLEKLEDTAAATKDALLSVQLDPSRIDTQSMLADLQSDTLDEALYRTLRRLCQLEPTQLRHYVDSAELALEALSPKLREEALTSLQARAVGAWRGFAPVESGTNPEELVAWSIEQLAQLYIQTDQAQRALDLFVDASRLPFDRGTCLDMRIRAATIATDLVKDSNSGIDMYRAILSIAPDNSAALQALIQLYTKKKRLPELLALRRQELQFETDPDEAMKLRLGISTLINQIDKVGGRLELLRANLEHTPGHRSTINAVSNHLSSMGKFSDLAAILKKQAQILEKHQRLDRAAQLWDQLAHLAEQDLQDIDLALDSYRKVANLAPNLNALDSLARLYIGREQSAAAVPWLEQALDLADDESKPMLVKRLALAHLSADHREEAIACLHEATKNPERPVRELRIMLMNLYKESKDWQELADTITAVLPFIEDNDQVIAFAQEASGIYHTVLRAPEKAIPALTRALSIEPDNRELRLLMARSQRVAENLEQAREILDGLLADFGRRRSKERAAVHVEYAHVARAEADLDAAMRELELASKMDPGNAHILRSLADLAREQGDLDQAERSLAALVLIVRRQQPNAQEDDFDTSVGISEVLFELHHIAAVRDDEEKAKENLESVIEAASTSDMETLRLRRTLLSHKEYKLLAKVLRTRISLGTDPTSKVLLIEHLSELLSGPLESPAEALHSRLEAVALLPSDEKTHSSARNLAKELNKSDLYLQSLQTLITGQRRSEESELSAQLLMRAGRVAEEDLQDLEAALGHYKAAEELLESPVDALFAIARVCAQTNNTEEQTRALDALTKLAVQEGPVVAQAGALYRLAELQVVQPKLVERGVALLLQAVELEPRYRQAALTLQQAAITTDNQDSVMKQYESAARNCNDKLILLDFLERKSSQGTKGATIEEIREAVQIADELDLRDRSIALLQQALASAKATDEGVAGAIWAAEDLVAHYAKDGQRTEARTLLSEISEIAPVETVRSLGMMLIAQHQEHEEALESAEIYDFLRKRSPEDKALWAPLLDLYIQLEDNPSILNLIDETLPTLVDAQERTSLRLRKSTILLETGKQSDAIALLKETYLDDPESSEAADLLESILSKQEDSSQLHDFLWQRFNDSKDRKDKERVGEIACRLGALLEKMDNESFQVYEQALAIAPSNPDLLRSVLKRLPESVSPLSRADLTERLLRVESPDKAAALALDLVEQREALNDVRGVERALALGQKACPTHEEIRNRLQAWYTSQESWGPLATMKFNEVEVAQSDEEKVALLRQAAAIYRDKLSDNTLCISALSRAQSLTPANGELASELAAVHASMTNWEQGVEALSTCLENLDDINALPILLMRADLLQNMGKSREALVDLEKGLKQNREMVEPLLLQALNATKLAAQKQGDTELERSTTLRLVQVYQTKGSEEEARQILFSWIEHDSDDLVALRKLRDMDQQAERWDGVVTATTHLVRLEDGPEQVASALLLADAAAQIGATEHGRGGLQLVHHDQPDNREIRDRLQELYRRHEEYQQLAQLLIVDSQWSTDPDKQYENYCAAASLFIEELNDPSAAIEPAQKAMELRPDDHTSILLLVDVLISSGQLDQAVDMLGPAIAKHKRRSPELASLQHRMSTIFAAQGNQAEQLSWLKKAFDVNRKDGPIASELAHLATELGDYDLALKPLRSITLMDDPQPVSRVMALLWEAKIEHARNNRAKAAMLAKKALREDPDYTEAEEFLVQLSE